MWNLSAAQDITITCTSFLVGLLMGPFMDINGLYDQSTVICPLLLCPILIGGPVEGYQASWGLPTLPVISALSLSTSKKAVINHGCNKMQPSCPVGPIHCVLYIVSGLGVRGEQCSSEIVTTMFALHWWLASSWPTFEHGNIFSGRRTFEIISEIDSYWF